MPSDRFYLRGDYPRPPATVLLWLVAAMVAAFVLQLALLSPWLSAAASLPDQCALTVRGIQQGHVWTLFTHGFLHSTGNPLHLVFSLITLVLIGRELEPQLGARRLLAVFSGALVLGALCWLGLHWRLGGVHLGPGAGLMGLLVVLACIYSGQKLTFMPFFVFTVTMRPLYLIYGLVGVHVLMLALYEATGSPMPLDYSPTAHLGGMLAGWLYFRYFHANNGWDRAAGLPRPGWLRWPRLARPAPVPPSRREPALLRADVDRILDKINSQGFGSLTKAEKLTLDEAKDLLSKQ